MERFCVFMIRSMTGYGRAQKVIDGKDILVEIRSINHRFFDFNARVPRSYGYLEEKLKSLVAASISRGKVEIFVTVNLVDGTDEQIKVNLPLAKSYLDAINELAENFELRNDATAMSLTRFSDIFIVNKVQEDEDKIWLAVKEVAEEALDAFIKMREVEGEKLRADILSRGETIISAVEKIEARSPEIVSAYRTRLTEKIKAVLEDKNIDEARIVTEAAIFADKVAVDEETVRLRSHIAQMNEMLDSSDAIGRKFDFLVQEMNREINTIGSKNLDLVITGIVVDVKSELEKIREQIQNIE